MSEKQPIDIINGHATPKKGDIVIFDDHPEEKYIFLGKFRRVDGGMELHYRISDALMPEDRCSGISKS